MTTGCTAERFGDHDYSQSPHTTPEEPVPADGRTDCMAQVARIGACEHDQRYRVVIYQIGTHEWIELLCCTPCTATLRDSARNFGPRKTNGIHSVRGITR